MPTLESAEIWSSGTHLSSGRSIPGIRSMWPNLRSFSLQNVHGLYLIHLSTCLILEHLEVLTVSGCSFIDFPVQREMVRLGRLRSLRLELRPAYLCALLGMIRVPSLSEVSLSFPPEGGDRQSTDVGLDGLDTHDSRNTCRADLPAMPQVQRGRPLGGLD